MLDGSFIEVVRFTGARQLAWTWNGGNRDWSRDRRSSTTGSRNGLSSQDEGRSSSLQDCRRARTQRERTGLTRSRRACPGSRSSQSSEPSGVVPDSVEDVELERRRRRDPGGGGGGG